MSLREQNPIVNNSGSPQHENIFSLHRSVTIVTPQRSNSLDYLNFEEKRQLIASTLSLSEILHCGSTTQTTKDISEDTMIGKLTKYNKIQMRNGVIPKEDYCEYKFSVE